MWYDKDMEQAPKEISPEEMDADTIANRWAEMPRMMARERIKQRTTCSVIDTQEHTQEILYALAPDEEGHQKSAYEVFNDFGVDEKERNQETPGWKELTKGFLEKSLTKTENWMTQHYDNLSEKHQQRATNFFENLKTLRSQAVWRDGDVTDIDRNLKYNALQWCPVKCQGDLFVHCRNYTNTEKVAVDKVEARLYMSPSLKNLVPLVDQIMQKYDEQDKRCYIKFATKGGRNDKLVLFTNYQSIDSDLKMLQEIQDEHPELFEEMGKNPLWGEMKGAPKGVYFGEEPKATGKFSYGTLRGQVFDRAYQRWKQAYGFDRDGKEHERQMVTSPFLPSPAMLVFRSMVGEEAQKAGIGSEVKTFCFNKDEW